MNKTLKWILLDTPAILHSTLVCDAQWCAGMHAGQQEVQRHSNKIPAIFLRYFWSNVIAPFLSARKREITQVHLLGTLTGIHSRTQWCITNEKSLGPFRSVRPAGLDSQAWPDPRAARPVPISNIYTIHIRK